MSLDRQNLVKQSGADANDSLFQLLFEQSCDASFLLDREVFIDCNLAAVEMMRCSTKQQLIRLHPAQISPECQPDGRNSLEKANEMIAIACAEGSHRFKWVHRRSDGEEFWVEVALTAVTVANRQIIYAVCRDISETKQREAERQQAEIALQQTQIRFRSLVDNIPGAVCRTRCDANWTIEYLSPMFEKISGYPLSDYLEHRTHSLLDFPHPDDAERVDRTVRDAIDRHQPYAVEYRFCHADGSIRWMHEKGQAFYDNDGKPLWSDGVFLDITDRKHTELTLQQAKETAEAALHDLQQLQTQLVQAEKMSSLGQLVAGVAHEINNPVSFIYGNLSHAVNYTQDLLYLLDFYQKEHPDPSPQLKAEIQKIDLDFLKEDLSKLLNSMKIGADRILDIVLSLRNFSRLDEAEYKTVDIHEGINSTLLILQSRLKPKSHHPGIQVIKTYGELPLVECYAGQLNQVFMNILVNALDALEERDRDRSLEEIQQHPSRISIDTRQLDPNCISICIKDNGLGIPDHLSQRIFDPFFTTKPIGKGTGLGMSISYRIVVEKHGGSLECRSKIGQGTQFYIQLPIYKAPLV